MIWNYFIHLGIENFTNQYGSKTKNQTIVDDKNKAGCCKCKSFIILLFIWIIVETIYWGLTQVFFLFFVFVFVCVCVFVFFWLFLCFLLFYSYFFDYFDYSYVFIDYSYYFIDYYWLFYWLFLLFYSFINYKSLLYY